MHSVTAAIIYGSYVCQLQSSQHQAVYVKSIKANHIPVVHTQLKMISGRYLGLTFKGM